jgi:hypothetical protein
MIAHPNRGRLTVDLGGHWRLYTNRLPHGGKALGLVTTGTDTGALVHIETTGLYVRVNAGTIISLPQSKVRAAIDETRKGSQGGPGRGGGLRAADGATNLLRRQVSLDPETIATLTAIGDGNLSLGIRLAAHRVSDQS